MLCMANVEYKYYLDLALDDRHSVTLLGECKIPQSCDPPEFASPDCKGE